MPCIVFVFMSQEPSSPSTPSSEALRTQLLGLLHEFLGGPDEPDAPSRYKRVEQLLGMEACRRLGLIPQSHDLLLSVVIPVYNEAATIEQIVHRVRRCGLRCEIILVDDGSTDGTRDVLDRLRGQSDLKIIFHEQNAGKGAALRTGFARAEGDVVVIQDADLEYDPRDFAMLLEPIRHGEADCVYGSRFSAGQARGSSLSHRVGNRLITLFSNFTTGQKLSDVETCYKMVRRGILMAILPDLKENDFAIEIELTARLTAQGVRIVERPITYRARSWSEGKKIGWRDGVKALWSIWRYRK